MVRRLVTATESSCRSLKTLARPLLNLCMVKDLSSGKSCPFLYLRDPPEESLRPRTESSDELPETVLLRLMMRRGEGLGILDW